MTGDLICGGIMYAYINTPDIHNRTSFHISSSPGHIPHIVARWFSLMIDLNPSTLCFTISLAEFGLQMAGRGMKGKLSNLMIQLRKNCYHPDLLVSAFDGSCMFLVTLN